jgi:hypothetical protein
MHRMMEYWMLILQVPLKIWRYCSTLASAQNPYKYNLAAATAIIIPDIIFKKRSGPCDSSNSTHKSLLSQLREQLQQSGFLEHLPALLTDAALQLQAAAGIWPAAGQDEARAVMESIPKEQTALHAARVFQLLENPVFPRMSDSPGSMLDARCVLPAAHLALACTQYLSTVLQDPQHRADPAWRPSEVQELLCSASFKVSTVCVNLVNSAMRHEPEITTASAPTGPYSPAAMYITHEAVRSRHHMECLSLNIAVLQLAHLVHKYRKACSTTNPGPASSWLPTQLADKVMLVVWELGVGCFSKNVVWQKLRLSNTACRR